jgi:hypothetical protein
VILICPDCHLEDKTCPLESNADKDFLRCSDKDCTFELSATELMDYVMKEVAPL